MEDRELLELAAKAAGIEIEYVPAATRNKGSSLTKFEVTAWNGPFIAGSHGEEGWNPLHDDGDALRLLVQLRLEIEQSNDGERVYAASRKEAAHVVHIGAGMDPFSATRRAIVLAAAEVAQSAPSGVAA